MNAYQAHYRLRISLQHSGKHSEWYTNIANSHTQTYANCRSILRPVWTRIKAKAQLTFTKTVHTPDRIGFFLIETFWNHTTWNLHTCNAFKQTSNCDIDVDIDSCWKVQGACMCVVFPESISDPFRMDQMTCHRSEIAGILRFQLLFDFLLLSILLPTSDNQHEHENEPPTLIYPTNHTIRTSRH